MSCIEQSLNFKGTLKLVPLEYKPLFLPNNNWVENCWKEFTTLTQDEEESLEMCKKFSIIKQIYEDKLKKQKELTSEKKQIDLILLAKNKQKKHIEKELNLLDSDIKEMAEDIIKIETRFNIKNLTPLKPSRKGGPRAVICDETGEVWESATACAKHFGVNLCNVVQSIKYGTRLKRKYKLRYVTNL